MSSSPVRAEEFLPCSIFYCQKCAAMTRFLAVSRAVRIANVSRSTMYYWMDRGWVHWRVLPSGRRVICLEGLSRSAKTTRGQPAPEIS